MKKIALFLLCGISINCFASDRVVSSPVNSSRQEQAYFNQASSQILEQKFLVATTVKSARSAALTASRAISIAKNNTVLLG